jgi:hypothetical protein
MFRHRRTALAMLAAIAFAPGCVEVEAQRVEGAFDRTLTVSGTPEVEVVTGSGRIEVQAGPPGRIQITGKIRGSDGWGWNRRGPVSLEERVRRIEASPPIEQSGNVVRIGRLTDKQLADGVSISYTVTVPAPSSLRAKTGSGSQLIDGVEGGVEASSGSGSLTLREIGGRSRASTGSGSITADTVDGAFHASAGSGSIRATRVAGAITAKTSSGSIDIEQTRAGEVTVSSGSGSVRLRGVRGAVQASTSSGGLTIDGDLSDGWRLSSSSGSVIIGLARSQGFELDATTSSGRIEVDFPVAVTGTISRRSLRGSTQGGGPLLRVRTSSGGISIQKREQAAARTENDAPLEK